MQGENRGELKWEELRDVKWTRLPSVELVVAGASVHLYDLYDRPLFRIYDQIRTYWR